VSCPDDCVRFYAKILFLYARALYTTYIGAYWKALKALRRQLIVMVSSLTRLYLFMSFNSQFDIYTDDIDNSGAVGVCKRLSFRSAATFNIQTLTQP